jgi:hypothetical protein
MKCLGTQHSIDDTFIPSWIVSLPLLIDDLQKNIEGITKWLKNQEWWLTKAKLNCASSTKYT